MMPDTVLRGDQIVTRVIWLDNTNANDLIPALRPLMPQFAHLSAGSEDQCANCLRSCKQYLSA